MDLEEMGVNMRNWVDSPQIIDYWIGFTDEALNLQVSLAMELVTAYAIKLSNVKCNKCIYYRKPITFTFML